MRKIYIKFVILAQASIISLYSQAQKIDLDKFSINYQYIKLPQNSLLIGFDTYNANPEIDKAVISQRSYTGNKIEGYFKFEGYGYANDNNGFTYTVKVEKPFTASKDVLEKKVDIKNSAGQIVSVLRYQATLKQAVPVTLRLTNSKTGAVLYEESFGGKNDPYSVVTGEYETRDQANKSLEIADGVFHPKVTPTFQFKFDETAFAFVRKFNTSKKEESMVFWKLDDEKAPGYEQLNINLIKAKNCIEKIKYNQSLENARAEMAPILASWRENLAKVQLEDKKGRKLKYGYLINIAKSQFCLELFDECEKTCQEIIDNDYDKKDGRELLSEIAEIKLSFQNTKLTTRHFARKGYELSTKYEYGSMFVKDLKELKDVGVDLANSSVQLKNELKEGLIRKTIKDSLRFDEADLSDFRYISNGQELSLNHLELGHGYAVPVYTSTDKTTGYYDVSLGRIEGFLKKGSLLSFDLSIYPNKKYKGIMNADSIIALLKANSTKKLNFMESTMREKLNNDEPNPRYIAYQKKVKELNNQPYLFAKIRFQTQQMLVDQIISDVTLGTRKDQTAIVEFVDAIPIKLKTLPKSDMLYKAYLVTLKISQLEFAEFGNMEYEANKNHIENFKDLKVTFIMTTY